MARTFSEVVKELDRTAFIEMQEAKAPHRRARRTGQKPKTGTLFALRNKRLAIREASLRNSQIAMTYRKVDGTTEKYIVAPYSYRYRRLKAGTRKMLFAYDMEKRHIKGFVLRGIRKVAITDRKFVPKWPVEIR